MKYFIRCITTRYFKFSGRASRTEFWMYILFLVIFTSLGTYYSMVVIEWYDKSYYLRPLSDIRYYSFAVFLLTMIPPTIAVTVRRFHDINHSAWWLLLCNLLIVTGIGILLIIYHLCRKGTPGPNEYGNDPLLYDDMDIFGNDI